MTDDFENLLAQVREREWFYRFELPDGSATASYLPPSATAVHDTRLEMMVKALAPIVADGAGTGLDLASHQGWFTHHLAEMGLERVTGLEPRDSHIDDARLIHRVLGNEQVEFVQAGIEQIGQTPIEPADVVLMLGLIYHLENPVAAIRTAFAYTRRVCLIETQVGPHVSGQLDWGSYEFVRPIQGCFTIIDETDETHGPEASLGGICLAPSAQTLVWIMQKVGFQNVSLLPVPADGYEQHRHGKRVMAIGFREDA